jgi:cytochrome c-type biogenesis protein CcmH
MRHKILIAGLTVFILVSSVLAAMAVQDAQEESLQKTARELNALIMCPICSGQTIGQSTTETSSQMRDLVLKKLRRGKTKEEVLQYFASKYGERILAEPTKRGFNRMLWLLPFVIVVVAVAVISFLMRRWSTRVSVETEPRPDENHKSEYLTRLEKELKEFGDGL